MPKGKYYCEYRRKLMKYFLPLLILGSATCIQKLNEKDQQLLEAFKNDKIDLTRVSTLLNQGANPLIKDQQGSSLLAIATVKGDARAVKVLIDQGIDPSKDPIAMKVAFTPTLIALFKPYRKPRPEGVKVIKVSMPPGTPDEELRRGVYDGGTEKVIEALAQGAFWNQKMDSGETLLEYTRNMIAEFEDVGLDPRSFREIEALLLEASQKKE